MSPTHSSPTVCKIVAVSRSLWLDAICRFPRDSDCLLENLIQFFEEKDLVAPAMTMEQALSDMEEEVGKRVFEAGTKGDVVALHRLFLRGANIMSTNKSSQNLYACAAINGRKDIVDYLVESGFSGINDPDIDARLPLFHAILGGHETTAASLVTGGAVLYVADCEDEVLEVMMDAIIDSNIPLVQRFLKYGFDPNKSLDCDDHKPLMFAIMEVGTSPLQGKEKKGIGASR